MSKSKAEDLAEQHWSWLEKHFHTIFIEAFIHGYKHSEENKNE